MNNFIEMIFFPLYEKTGHWPAPSSPEEKWGSFSADTTHLRTDVSNGQEGSGGICGVLGAGGQGGLRISPVGGRQGGVHVVVPAAVESQTEPRQVWPSAFKVQTTDMFEDSLWICTVFQHNLKVRQLRVEGSEGLIVEPEDQLGALLPQLRDDPAGQLCRAALQHLQARCGGCKYQMSEIEQIFFV